MISKKQKANVFLCGLRVKTLRSLRETDLKRGDRRGRRDIENDMWELIGTTGQALEKAKVKGKK